MWNILAIFKAIWDKDSKLCGKIVNGFTDWVDGRGGKYIAISLILVILTAVVVFPILLMLSLVWNFLVIPVLICFAWNWTIGFFSGVTIPFTTAVGLFLILIILKDLKDYWRKTW